MIQKRFSKKYNTQVQKYLTKILLIRTYSVIPKLTYITDNAFVDKTKTVPFARGSSE